MKKSDLGFFLLISVPLLFVSCTQQSSQTAAAKRLNAKGTLNASADTGTNSSTTNTGTNTSTSSNPNPTPSTPGGDVRHATVSAFNLDDDRFLILDFTVGLESFINAQTPVLNFQPVLDIDYTELMRCPATAVIAGATATLNLTDLELSTMSLTDRENMYRQNDFWSAAVNAGCVQLTTGEMGLNFMDTWAPTGTWRYLARGCINPQRLTDTDKLTNRNCSREISITIPLKDYVNTRTKELNQYLQQAASAQSNILTSLIVAKQQADAYACFLQWCECGASPTSICARDSNGVPVPCTGGSRGAAVALAKKNAIVTLVAVGCDVALTAATSGEAGGLKAISQSTKGLGQAFGGVMTVAGYGASLNGMSFSAMFTALSAQTQDIPKTCAQGVSIDLQMSADSQAVQAAQAEYNFYQCRALAYKTQLSSGAGDSTSPDFSACPATTSPPPPPTDSSSGTDTNTGVGQ